MIEVEEGRIPGLIRLCPTVYADDRGMFVKNYQEGWFADLGLPVSWPERFYSRSHRRVIRGLHFQSPPADHDKLVYCVRGAAMDVAVDLRVGSPTYGDFDVFDLKDDNWSSLFIPKGLAHGFAALMDATVMAYATTTGYDSAMDAGIRWDSLPIPWPFADPIISPRDAALPPFAEFVSSFTY
ncbi:MAG TPA: dTDP-4-dehydrorhamnose 3,5-epimerase family protein [Acidimicrobiales bacterium]|nr:dTDP-4-dehydrorhamnose 3,5-epimerase family protein [Acidimicrobiales bacterium]